MPSDLYGPPPKPPRKTVAGGHRPDDEGQPGTGRKVAVGCRAVGLLFFIGPIIAGVALFAGPERRRASSPTATEPVPAGPPFELSAAGLRDYLATFEDSFDDTQVVRAVFYDGYVVSWVPQDDGNVASGTTSNGAFDQLGDPMDGTTSTPRRSTSPTSSRAG